MASNNKLYITISDNRSGDSGSIPTQQTANQSQPQSASASGGNNDGILGRYIEHEMFHMVKQQVQQFANYALGNIGNFTGDYVTQNHINDMRANISGFMNIGMSTIAGAKVGGWVGAIVGFAVGTVAQVSSGVYDTISKINENGKTNYEIAQLRDRSGLNQKLDGSRGTEN